VAIEKPSTRTCGQRRENKNKPSVFDKESLIRNEGVGGSNPSCGMAVNLLAEAGFTNVYNIIDGMEGDLVEDPDSVYRGKRLRNGWKNSGLPWTYDLDPKKTRLPTIQMEMRSTAAGEMPGLREI
jgi:hypothetical protein